MSEDYITVNEKLEVSVTIESDVNEICEGEEVNFTATPVNGGVPSYQWKVNDVAVGDNTSFDKGKNKSDMHQDFIIKNPTVYFDQKIVIKNVKWI